MKPSPRIPISTIKVSCKFRTRKAQVTGRSHQERPIVGNFAGADDILWAAQQGELISWGPICIERSGRIGPIVEVLLARRASPEDFSNVRFSAPFATLVQKALDESRIAGTAFRARSGVFPISQFEASQDGGDQWKLWCARVEQAAIGVGFPKPLAAALVGATGELLDNVFRHSRVPESGLAAFAATTDTLEIVVADSGVGVLASLREHSDYAALRDAGAALKVAIEDGNSRLGRSSGDGFGMGQMFRALVNHEGQLRFRSDDHALSVSGHSPSLQGHVELGHKARLNGLTVSVLCQVPGRSNQRA